MVVDSILDRLRGGGTNGDGERADSTEPSHVCQSCGEEYYADPDVDIRSCRGCGGIRVEAV